MARIVRVDASRMMLPSRPATGWRAPPSFDSAQDEVVFLVCCWVPDISLREIPG